MSISRKPLLDRRILGEGLRFCIVGALATGIHYALYWLFKHWMNVDLAFILGYAFSFVCNFLLTTRFTFKEKATVGNGAGFAFSHIVNLTFQVLLLNLFMKLGLNDNVAPVPVYTICVPVNFFMVRFFFKDFDSASIRFFVRRPFVVLILLTILIVTVGLLPDWLQYGVFFVGGDFADQQIPFIIETKRMLASGVPFWSWNTYFGQSFIASYSFYTLTSPFVWIACLFPYDSILTGITLTLYLKFICAGAASYVYLREMDVSKHMSVVGGLLYAFSSFVILNVNFFHFFEPLICFPLFLFAIERFLKGKGRSFSLLMGVSFVTAFVNWYFIPCSFLAAVLYTGCRVFGRDGIRIPWKRMLVGVSAVAAGVLMVSAVLFPTIHYLYGNPRMDMSMPVEFSQYGILTWLQQVRSLFVPKVEEASNSSPWVFNTFSSSAASLPVIGVCLPALYLLKNRDWLRPLIFISTILFITPLNGVFSLFTDPSYSRWAYALTLFFVLASVKYLDSGGRVGRRSLIIYVFVSVSVYLFFRFPVFWMRYKSIDTSTVISRATDWCIFSSFLLSLMAFAIYRRRQKWYVLLAMITVFCCFYLGVRIYQRTDCFYAMGNERHYRVFDTYINSSIPISYDNMECRTDFITRGDVVYANMAMLKNMPSVSSYNSVKTNRIEALVPEVNSYKVEHNFIVPDLNRTSFDALMSVKTVIDFHDPLTRQEQVMGITLVLNHKDYSEFAFDYYIPMGFTYDSYILESEIEPLLNHEPPFDVPKQLLANLVINDDEAPLIAGYLPKGSLVPEGSPLDSIVCERRKNVCSSFIGDSKGFKAEVELDKDDVIFFSVPADPGFSATIDGKGTSIIKANLGLSAILVPAGQHTIIFRYMPPGLICGIIVSLSMFLLFILSLFIEFKFR